MCSRHLKTPRRTLGEASSGAPSGEGELGCHKLDPGERWGACHGQEVDPGERWGASHGQESRRWTQRHGEAGSIQFTEKRLLNNMLGNTGNYSHITTTHREGLTSGADTHAKARVDNSFVTGRRQRGVEGTRMQGRETRQGPTQTPSETENTRTRENQGN